MKIGVIGIGNIAQKAYLPTYAASRNQAEFIFATRNEEIREEIAEKYGFSKTVATLEELLEQDISACFVHVATKAHAQVVRELLQKGIDVFVDKPLSEKLSEVSELQKLAEDKQCLLMIGFNRRFAPMVQRLKAVEDKNFIMLQKNRIAAAQPTDFVIYDLFLHVVDTAVYLLEEPIAQVQTKIIEENGQLKRAILYLETSKTTAICSMNLCSGANTETFQVMGEKETVYLDNLTELTIKNAKETTQQSFNDWATTLEKRGFEQMVTSFIKALHTRKTEELKQKNTYLSHKLCAEMIYKRHHQTL